MEVKIKAERLEPIISTLEELAKREFNPSLSWDIAILMNDLTPYFTTYNEMKTKIFKKYGEEGKDDKGNIIYSINKEKVEEFQKEFAEMNDKELTISFKSTISKDAFKDEKIKPSFIFAIVPFLNI